MFFDDDDDDDDNFVWFRLWFSEAALVPPEEVLAVGTLVGDAVQAVDAAWDAGARPKSEMKI